jgi:hypothetical protein
VTLCGPRGDALSRAGFDRIGVTRHAGPAAPALVALLAAWPAEARSLTGTQATYSIAKALTAGTPVEIVNVPADDRQLSLQKGTTSSGARARSRRRSPRPRP